MDWDWWETATPTHTIPADYNIDPTSEDFGTVSIGGNNSQIDATTEFVPTITGNFLAYVSIETASLPNASERFDAEQNSLGYFVPVLNDNQELLGHYQETFIVGVFAQDLGNGDWSYLEKVGYSYNYTSVCGSYNYKDGYEYSLEAKSIGGIYTSTFSLTTGYSFMDGFTIGEEPEEEEETNEEEEETDQSAFYWKVAVEYSVTDTITITYSHNTLTSQRGGSDTRTTLASSSYYEIGLYSEDGYSYSMHDISWANSSSETNVYYLWSNGGWQISGSATATGGYGYDWGETLDATHATGTIYVSTGSFHEENSSASWFYDSVTDAWIANFVSGEGGGNYYYIYHWDSEKAYERPFYTSTITGTENAYIDYNIHESWDVSFCIVNGIAIRESEGEYTVNYKSGSSYDGSGSHYEDKPTSTPGTYYVGYQAHPGTTTTYFEREATLLESGSQTYSETIEGTWSNKADHEGQLVWQESADMEITATADGFYELSLYVFSFSQFDGAYSNSSSCSYSCGTHNTYSESEQWTEITEWYGAELNETYIGDGGAFYLVSFEGEASGGGIYDAESSSNSTSKTYNEWGYSGCDHGCGCSCGSYSGYNCETYKGCSDSWRNVAYDYTADWSWDACGWSADVENHVTRDVGGTSTSTWNYESGSNGCGCGCGSSCGCGCGCSCGCGCGCNEGNYDELVSYTGWRNGEQVVLPFAVRWSPFSASLSDGCGCGCGCSCGYGCGCCSYDYSYSGANFSAPNFSVSIWEATYDYGNNDVEIVTGYYIKDPGGTVSWVSNYNDVNCFTAGTQIVVGAEYDENDVFVQYITKNIEDIEVGDLVYSYDTITGTVELKEVTAVFVREADHINYLTIEDENGNIQTLEVTDVHPFWVVTDEPDLERAARGLVDENGVWLYHENIGPTDNGFWVEAKDLREGDVFLGANGELSTVVSNERVEFPEGVTVYNFTVDGNHNYFVIAQGDESGQTCVLVHNAERYKSLKLFNLNVYKSDRFNLSVEPLLLYSEEGVNWKNLLDTKKSFFPELWNNLGGYTYEGFGFNFGAHMQTGPHSRVGLGVDLQVPKSQQIDAVPTLYWQWQVW